MSTLRKKVFSTVSMKFFFFRLQNTRIFLFLLNLILERKSHNARAKHFQKHFLHWKYGPALRKKIFSTTTVKFFSLKCLKNWRSLVFASMKVWGGSRVTVGEWKFSYRIVYIENSKYVSTLHKDVFICIREVFLFLYPKTLWFFHVCWSQFERDQGS